MEKMNLELRLTSAELEKSNRLKYESKLKEQQRNLLQQCKHHKLKMSKIPVAFSNNWPTLSHEVLPHNLAFTSAIKEENSKEREYNDHADSCISRLMTIHENVNSNDKHQNHQTQLEAIQLYNTAEMPTYAGKTLSINHPKIPLQCGSSTLHQVEDVATVATSAHSFLSCKCNVPTSVEPSKFYIKSFHPWNSNASIALCSADVSSEMTVHQPKSKVLNMLNNADKVVLNAFNSGQHYDKFGPSFREKTDDLCSSSFNDTVITVCNGLFETCVKPTYTSSYTPTRQAFAVKTMITSSVQNDTTLCNYEPGIHSSLETSAPHHVSFNGKLPENMQKEFTVSEFGNNVSNPMQTNVKGILKKDSKSSNQKLREVLPISYPVSVGVGQRWIEKIADDVPVVNQQQACSGVLKIDEKREPKQPIFNVFHQKSVRWHLVHYSDGTSISISENYLPTANSFLVSTSQPETTAKRKIQNAGNRKTRISNHKPKSPQTNSKGVKKGLRSTKSKKVKKLKEVKPLKKTCPPTNMKKELTLVTTLEYSIQNDTNTSASRADLVANQEKIVNKNTQKPSSWLMDKSKYGNIQQQDYAVTENSTTPILKSAGLGSTKVTDYKSLNSVENIDDQESQMRHYKDDQPCRNDIHGSFFKLPIDYDINLLCNKVRSCLFQQSRRRYGLQLQIPRSDNVDSGTEYGAYLKNWTSLRQRKYSPTNMSYSDQPVLGKSFISSSLQLSEFITNSLLSPRNRFGHIDEKTIACWLTEILAEQNMPKDQMIQVIDSLQAKTRYAQHYGKKVIPLTLSSEEQTVLKALGQLSKLLQGRGANLFDNPGVSTDHILQKQQNFCG